MIFISYRRNDSADIAGRLFDHLNRAVPDEVFKDVDSIPPGVHFPRYLAEHLARCRVLLAVIGPAWAGTKDDGTKRINDPDDFVRAEIEAALARNIAIVPVLVTDVPMPSVEQLPEALRALAHLQGINVRPDPDFKRDVEKLLKSLITLLPQTSKKRRRKRVILALAVVINLACGLGVLAYQASKNYRQQNRVVGFLRPEPYAGFLSWILGSPYERAVRRYAALEHGAQAKKVRTAWIFVGYYDEDRDVFTEGPYARVIFRPAAGTRGEILPQVGDVLEIVKARRLIIAGYRSHGTQNELIPPASVNDSLALGYGPGEARYNAVSLACQHDREGRGIGTTASPIKKLSCQGSAFVPLSLSLLDAAQV